MAKTLNGKSSFLGVSPIGRLTQYSVCDARTGTEVSSRVCNNCLVCRQTVIHPVIVDSLHCSGSGWLHIFIRIITFARLAYQPVVKQLNILAKAPPVQDLSSDKI